MKPYGFDSLGSHAMPYEKPGKPHCLSARDSVRVNRAAARRRPKRTARQRARDEIRLRDDDLYDFSEKE